MRDKSEENWQVGQRCLMDGNLNAASSRIYYATLQAVLFWARAKKGYSKTAETHKDMCKFVASEGKQSRFYGQKFRDMRALRETADYQPDPTDAEELNQLIPDCKQIRDYFLRMAETP